MRSARIASVLAMAIAASEGKSLYETKCAQCHGKDGIAKPPGKGSKNFNDPAFQSGWSEDAIAKITSDGKGKMPAYRNKLSPEQIKAVAAHVKTLGSSNP
jgi:cytochrome c6